MKIFKIIIGGVLMTIYTSTAINAQDIDINYYPPKTDGVSAKDYNKGVRDLAYAYADIEAHTTRNLDYVDYWRVAVAYIYMGVSRQTVYKLLLKSKENSKEGFCIILNVQLNNRTNNTKESRFYTFLGQEYLEHLSDCSGVNIEPVNSNPNSFPKLKKKGNYVKWKEINQLSVSKKFNKKKVSNWLNKLSQHKPSNNTKSWNLKIKRFYTPWTIYSYARDTLLKDYF